MFPPCAGDWFTNDCYMSSNGHQRNPGCQIGNKACSKELYPGFNLCYWHAHRMGNVVEQECACGNHQVIVGDHIGRELAREYCKAINFSEPKAQICSAGTLWCCGSARYSSECIGKCGDMKVCSLCAKEHTQLDLDDDQCFPLETLPPGISGIKCSGGWLVTVKMSNTFSPIQSYADAINVYNIFLQKEDSQAKSWYILASHMPDRPDYITPIPF